MRITSLVLLIVFATTSCTDPTSKEQPKKAIGLPEVQSTNNHTHVSPVDGHYAPEEISSAKHPSNGIDTESRESLRRGRVVQQGNRQQTYNASDALRGTRETTDNHTYASSVDGHYAPEEILSANHPSNGIDTESRESLQRGRVVQQGNRQQTYNASDALRVTREITDNCTYVSLVQGDKRFCTIQVEKIVSADTEESTPGRIKKISLVSNDSTLLIPINIIWKKLDGTNNHYFDGIGINTDNGIINISGDGSINMHGNSESEVIQNNFANNGRGGINIAGGSTGKIVQNNYSGSSNGNINIQGDFRGQLTQHNGGNSITVKGTKDH
ncbi:MAG: hypothetical protein AAF963_02745, partial [Bacteroidota bacterium]